MYTKEEDCTKIILQDADAYKRLHNFKRKLPRERGNITRSVTEIREFNNTTKLEDYQYYKERLHEILGRPTSLDEIPERLDDSEYDTDLRR
jgi:transcription elongation GreA/GreB family factor